MHRCASCLEFKEVRAMRIMIPIHPAFLSEKGSNITQNERSYERSLKEVMKEVLKETDFKKQWAFLK